MAQTVPGGRYQSADGSWHDANGNPVDALAESEQVANDQDTTSDVQDTETKRKRK